MRKVISPTAVSANKVPKVYKNCSFTNVLISCPPLMQMQQRHFHNHQAPGQDRPNMFKDKDHIKAGFNLKTKNTEVYDGSTNSLGTFKEGAPVALRLEYIRKAEVASNRLMDFASLWSPFQLDRDRELYSPLFYDYVSDSSRDYFGKRTGIDKFRYFIGVNRKRETRSNGETSHQLQRNHYLQRHVPKWLACVVNDPRGRKMLGFFLYANGAYCIEGLTYKQLPRLVYNKPFQGFVPTLGQTVDLNEVTYGKEVHSVSFYPQDYAGACKKDGESAVVLRGSEPNLVPLLLPGKEIRLFDSTCYCVFGRRAGVMREYQRNSALWTVLRPKRPRLRAKARSLAQHPNGGGNSWTATLPLRLDFRIHPFNKVKTKHWLAGYTLRSGYYNKHKSVADLKQKTYSWKDRDPVYH